MAGMMLTGRGDNKRELKIMTATLKCAFVLALSALFFVRNAGAGDQAALKAVLARAIQAAGGADKLKALHGLTCSASGVAVIFGDKERDIAFAASLVGVV